MASLLINGNLTPGDLEMQVLNPATEEVLASCPRASKRQLDAAVAAAKAAFPAWAATPIEHRRAAVVKMADIIEANVRRTRTPAHQRAGQAAADATGEVMGMAAFFRYFGSLDLPMKVIESSGNRRVEALSPPARRRRRDHPVELSAADPELQVAVGAARGQHARGQTGADDTLVDAAIRGTCEGRSAARRAQCHCRRQRSRRRDDPVIPDIRKISFTGSTATGKKVMASAAETLKRITFELGGNDAGIVLDDVDPKKSRRASSKARSRTAARFALPSSASMSTNPSTTRCATNWSPWRTMPSSTTA